MLHVFLSGGYGEYIDGDSHIHYVAIVQKKASEASRFFQSTRRTFTGGPDWRNYR